MGKIAFFEEDVRVSFLKRTAARMCLLKVLERLNRTCGSVNYVFCSDEYLLEINRQYLQHDTFTDIVTFDYSSGEDVFPEETMYDVRNARSVSGDIYISIDRIKENAKKFHVEPIDELNRVMIHGLLHLAGYKDKRPEEEKAMHAKEDEMLQFCFPGYEYLKEKRGE